MDEWIGRFIGHGATVSLFQRRFGRRKREERKGIGKKMGGGTGRGRGNDNRDGGARRRYSRILKLKKGLGF